MKSNLLFLIKKANIFRCIVMAFFLIQGVWAQTGENVDLNKEKQESDAKTPSLPAKTPSKKTMLLDELNINGDRINNLFILGTQLELGTGDQAVQTSIEQKSLAKDEFYMQNIDREEFETEKLLRDLKESEQSYGTSVAALKKYLEDKKQ